MQLLDCCFPNSLVCCEDLLPVSKNFSFRGHLAQYYRPGILGFVISLMSQKHCIIKNRYKYGQELQET